MAFAGYPLLVDGKLVGVFAMFARDQIPEDTLATLESIADLLAQGLVRRKTELELERKLEELRAVEPVAAQVTLCGARVTTSYAHALGSAAPALEMLRVGVNHDDAPPDLTTIVGTPQPMPVEDASVRVVCGDAGDAFAHVERYGFHHKVIVRMSKEDALRLTWDGAIEVSLDVLYE